MNLLKWPINADISKVAKSNNVTTKCFCLFMVVFFYVWLGVFWFVFFVKHKTKVFIYFQHFKST